MENTIKNCSKLAIGQLDKTKHRPALDETNSTDSWEQAFNEGLQGLLSVRDALLKENGRLKAEIIAADNAVLELRNENNKLSNVNSQLITANENLLERVELWTVRASEAEAELSSRDSRCYSSLGTQTDADEKTDIEIQTDECKDDGIVFEGLMSIQLVKRGEVYSIVGSGQDHGPGIVITPRMQREALVDTVETILHDGAVKEVTVNEYDEVQSLKLADPTDESRLNSVIGGMQFEGTDELITVRSVIALSELASMKGITREALVEDRAVIEKWMMFPSLTSNEEETIRDACLRVVAGWDSLNFGDDEEAENERKAHVMALTGLRKTVQGQVQQNALATKSVDEAPQKAEDQVTGKGKKYVALPASCGICVEGKVHEVPLKEGECVEPCGAETHGIEYYESDVLNGGSCKVCEGWVPRYSDRALVSTHYGDFTPGSDDVESLRDSGLRFFLNQRSSEKHICGTSCHGTWTLRDGVILVPAKPESKDFLEFINLFNQPGPSSRLPSIESIASDEPDESLFLDGIVDPLVISDESLLESALAMPNIASGKITIPQSYYPGGEFFDRIPRPSKALFGLHKTQAEGNATTSLIEALDNAAGGPWTVLNVQSGLSKTSVSFRCDVENSTDLFINHAGLYMMLRSMEALHDNAIVLMRKDLEDIHMSEDDLVVFLHWTRYAYSLCSLPSIRMNNIISGPYRDPYWSVGRVYGNVKVPFSPAAIKSRLISRDPVLASITGITITIPLFGSGDGKTDDSITMDTLAIIKGANIDVKTVEIVEEEVNGVKIVTIGGKFGKVNHRVKKYHLVGGTCEDKNYSTLGQIVRPVGEVMYRVCGVFAFMSSGYVSSAPHKVADDVADSMLSSICEDDLKKYLGHLAYMKSHMTGPSMQYQTSHNSVRVNGKSVTTLSNYNSRSFSAEFELCNDAVYHPRNRNCCPHCKAHFSCAVQCGRH